MITWRFQSLCIVYLCCKGPSLGCRPFRTRSLHFTSPTVFEGQDRLRTYKRAIPGLAVLEHPAATHLFGIFASNGYRLATCDLDFADGHRMVGSGHLANGREKAIDRFSI